MNYFATRERGNDEIDAGVAKLNLDGAVLIVAWYSPGTENSVVECICVYIPGGGGGGTPLYKLYGYVPPQRVWFFNRFGLKTGIDFDHYDLKSTMVFKGTAGAYKHICLLNSK